MLQWGGGLDLGHCYARGFLMCVACRVACHAARHGRGGREGSGGGGRGGAPFRVVTRASEWSTVGRHKPIGCWVEEACRDPGSLGSFRCFVTPVHLLKRLSGLATSFYLSSNPLLVFPEGKEGHEGTAHHLAHPPYTSLVSPHSLATAPPRPR